MRKWVVVITAASIIMAYGNAASAESVITPKKVILKVNNAGMFVDDATTSTLLDPQLYATPEIRNNRVMIPIASVIKEFGGSSSWSAKEKKVSLILGNNNVALYLNNTKAYVNGVLKTLDSAPITSNEGRTLVPLKFVSDNLGITLIWIAKIKSLRYIAVNLTLIQMITAITSFQCLTLVAITITVRLIAPLTLSQLINMEFRLM